MLPELTFVGTQLVQVRLHPYIVMDQAQPNLVTPTTDGKHVLDRSGASASSPEPGLHRRPSHAPVPGRGRNRPTPADEGVA